MSTEAAPTTIRAISSRSSLRRRRWGAASTSRVDERCADAAGGAGRFGKTGVRPIRGMPTGEVAGVDAVVAAPASCWPGGRADVIAEVYGWGQALCASRRMTRATAWRRKCKEMRGERAGFTGAWAAEGGWRPP